jgi:sugar phosphate isomerase/epimerase
MARLATVAAFGFPDFNPVTLLDVYRQWGCVSCQYYRNVHNAPRPAEARKLVEDLGLPFDSIHGVFGPEHDPSSPDEPTRRRAISTYRREGELALELGGPMVVVHPAPLAPDPTSITPATRGSRREPMLRSMQELAAVGELLGVTYLIENIPGNYLFGHDPFELAGMIRVINHPRLRMCFDIGHAHMHASAHGALASCADVVEYLHVHDNDTRADSHQIPGQGTVEWDAIATSLRRAPKNIPAMLELFDLEPVIRAQLGTGLTANLARWLSLSQV